MYTVGLDVDTLVFTVKTLLYAGNAWICSPLAFIALGTIYKSLFYLTGVPAGNFSFSVKATAIAKNIYNKFSNLPLISEHVPDHKANLSDEDFVTF